MNSLYKREDLGNTSSPNRYVHLLVRFLIKAAADFSRSILSSKFHGVTRPLALRTAHAKPPLLTL